MQAEEAKQLQKDRDESRAAISALQAEIELHREQVCAFSLSLVLLLPSSNTSF
jgi:hypothetical protein